MFSPIKTIIKNNGLRYYAYNSSEISFSIARNESIEINGDLFTYIKQSGDIDMLLTNIVHGLLEVSYVINSRFPVFTNIDVNMTNASTRQVKLLDKMIGVVPAKAGKKPVKKDEEAKDVAKSVAEETKSAVPTDAKKNENVVGFAEDEPKLTLPKDNAYAGMFTTDKASDDSAANNPAFGEGVVITEKPVKIAETNNAEIKVDPLKPAAAPKETTSKTTAPAQEDTKKPARKQVK